MPDDSGVKHAIRVVKQPTHIVSWLQLGISAIVILCGCVAAAAVVRSDIKRLSVSVDGLSADIKGVSDKITQLEEWRRNIGQIPTEREFEKLRRDLERLESYVVSVDELNRRFYDLDRYTIKPIRDLANRVGFYAHGHSEIDQSVKNPQLLLVPEPNDTNTNTKPKGNEE